MGIFGTCSCCVGPSLLASDMSRLADEASRVVNSGADYLHLDVMDGHFVPNITMGPPVIKSLRKHTKAVFDCHMMVSHPEQWVKDMADAGCNIFTFHLETTVDPVALIAMIRAAGMRAGVAIKPKTPVESVYPLVELVDMVLVMTVEPGFGGQEFMADMMPKVSALRARHPTMDIEVDGGLGPATIDAAAAAGANFIVAGSSVFKSDDPRATMDHMRGRVRTLGTFGST